MLRKFFIALTLVLLSSCNSPQNTDDVNLPLSDVRPSLLFFCESDESICLETYQLMNNVSSEYNTVLTYVYINIDSAMGRQWYEFLNLTDYPSYILFNSEKDEITRYVGVFERETVLEDLAMVLEQ